MSTCLPWTIYSLLHITLLKIIPLLSEVTSWSESSPKASTWPAQASVVCSLLPLWPLAIPLSPLLPCCVLTCEIYICHFLCLKRMSQDMHMACSPEKSRHPLINLNILSQPTSSSIQVPYPPIDNTQPASFFFTAFIPPEMVSIRMKLKVNRRFIHLLTGIPNAQTSLAHSRHSERNDGLWKVLTDQEGNKAMDKLESGAQTQRLQRHCLCDWPTLLPDLLKCVISSGN